MKEPSADLSYPKMVEGSTVWICSIEICFWVFVTTACILLSCFLQYDRELTPRCPAGQRGREKIHPFLGYWRIVGRLLR